MIAILLPMQHWWGYRTATTAVLLLPQSSCCCKTVTAVTWQLQQYRYCRDAQAKAVVLVLRYCYRWVITTANLLLLLQHWHGDNTATAAIMHVHDAILILLQHCYCCNTAARLLAATAT